MSRNVIFRQRGRVATLLAALAVTAPPPAEQARCPAALAEPGRKRGESFIDIAWALVNSAEFLLKH